MTLRSGRLEHWLSLSLIAAACGLYAAHSTYLAVPLVDDAAISIAFGKSFLSGFGFRLTPVSAPVEGFSNPLWTVLSALPQIWGGDLVRWTALLGTLLGGLALAIFSAWGPVLSRRDFQIEDAVAPIAGALMPAYVYWSSSGMETGLEVLLIAALGVALFRETATNRGAWTGLILGLLCLTRPEAPLLAVVAGAFWLIQRGFKLGRQGFQIVGWVLTVFGGWVAFRLLYFAAPLPNTFYAKENWDFHADEYLRSFLHAHLWLLVLAGLGVMLSAWGWKKEGRAGFLAWGFGLAVLVFVVKAKGDWMKEWRFLAPLGPLMGAVFSAGLSSIRSGLNEKFRLSRTWTSLGAWVGTVAFAYAGWAVAAVRSPTLKAEPEFSYGFVSSELRRQLTPFRELGLRQLLIAVPDIGGPGMNERDAEIMDDAGLADFAVARAGGGKAAEDYLWNEGPPIFVHAHGPSGFVRNFAWFTEYAPAPFGGFALKGLSKDEDPRCMGGKQTLLQLTSEALSERISSLLEAGNAVDALRVYRCVQAYLPPERLPARTRKAQISERATQLAASHIQRGEWEKATRCASLATILSDGDPHLRRWTESLRHRMFP